MKKKPSFSSKLKDKKDLLFGPSGDLPRIFEVRLADLSPNPDQPRKSFNEAELENLASSIERFGLQQPITVMANPEEKDKFIIVAGERRFKAHQILKRDTIYAILTTGNRDELALIENLQREDLDPIEEAESLRNIMDRHAYSQDELGKIIGKSQVAVSQSLSINALPEEVREDARKHPRVTRSLLIEIARHDNPVEVWKDVKDYGLTVRDIRKIKDESKPKGSGKKAKAKKAKAEDNKPINTLIVTSAKSLSKRLLQAKAKREEFSEDDLAALREARNQMNSLLGD